MIIPIAEPTHDAGSNRTPFSRRVVRVIPWPVAAVWPMASSAKSLSLAETNAMRAQLGMEPLSGDRDDAEAQEREEVAAARAVDEERRRKADLDEAAAKILAHKEERLYNASIQGASIADEYDASVSAADWVKNIKAKGTPAVRASAAPKRSRPVSTGPPAELRVRHDADEFAEGETVVLTLKDRRIGEGDDDAEDELENLDLVASKAVERNKARKAKKPRVGDEDDIDASRGVLQKYDEVKDELDAKRGGIRITAATNVVADRDRAIRAKLDNSKPAAKVAYDANVPAAAPSSDYYSKDEVVAFKKPSKKKKAAKSSARAKLVLDDEPVLGPSADHGSRGAVRTTVLARIDAANAELAARRERFQAAMQKSDARSHQLVDGLVFEQDLDDPELQISLAKARRVAQRKNDEQAEEQLPARRSQPTAKISAASNPADIETVAFSATSEFMTNLRVSTEELKERHRPVRKEVQVENGMHPEEHAPKEAVAMDVGGHDEEDMDVDGPQPKAPSQETAGSDEEEDTEEEIDHDEIKFMDDVAHASRGVSDALRLIRSRGLTRETKPILIAGRSHDARREEYKDPAPHIRLDRVDEFGRPMTAKEAFRELSYVFHGHAPGAKKREKLLKEMQQQIKAQHAVSGDAISSSERLRDATSKVGRHYAVMDSKSGAFGAVATEKLSIDTDASKEVKQEPDSSVHRV